jgi:hypothetical protein
MGEVSLTSRTWLSRSPQRVFSGSWPDVRPRGQRPCEMFPFDLEPVRTRLGAPALPSLPGNHKKGAGSPPTRVNASLADRPRDAAHAVALPVTAHRRSRLVVLAWVVAACGALTLACSSTDNAPSGAGAADGGGARAGTSGAAGGSTGESGSSGTPGGMGQIGGTGAAPSGGKTSGGGTAAAGASGATSRAGATGAGGSLPGSGGTGVSSGGQSGACTAERAACDPAKTVCCTGLICVTSTSADYAGCRQPCTKAGDCASGCCIPFGNFPDQGFCGDAALCQCSMKNETCGGTRQCCSGFTCTTFDSTGKLGCEPLCTKNADCTTNCCVAIPTTPDSACLAPAYCGH